MKKVEKVSIANISFTLDNDAYSSLKQYLDSLHNYYDKDPDGSEIIADIEARIAELILGEQVYTKVVSKTIIDRIVAQLGSPEEIDDDADEGAAAGMTGMGADTSSSSLPRRLHRSSEGKIIGGVCSGMARFWEINVAWIRLAFLLPMIMFIVAAPVNWDGVQNISGGWSWVFFVIYIVLWIALPIARTPRQKLEARGEKITPSSIRQNLQETATSPSAKKAASVAAEVFTVLGRILLFFVKIIVAIVGFSFLISAFSLFISMIVVLVNPVTVGGYAAISSALAGMAILSPMVFVALVLFCVLIPFIIIGIALLSLAFSWKTGVGRWFYITTLGLWLVAMVFCTVVIASNARFLHERNWEEWMERMEHHDKWDHNSNKSSYDEWENTSGEADGNSEEWESNRGESHTSEEGRVEIRRLPSSSSSETTPAPPTDE